MENISKHKLDKLRKEFVKNSLDGFLFGTSDEYINEYVPDYARRVEYLSGFKGSLALIIVLQKKAAIFIDGRYTLQAQKEVDSKYYDILPYRVDSIKQWLKKNASKIKIGLNTRILSIKELNFYENMLDSLNIEYSYIEEHLVDRIWENQPELPKGEVYYYGDKYSGKEPKDKIKLLVEHLKANQLDYMFIGSLDNIAWLLNIRGDDVENTPLVLSNCFISAKGECYLFIDLNKITKEVKDKLQMIEIKAIESQDCFVESLAKQEGRKRIALANNSAAYYGFLFRKKGFEVQVQEDYCTLLKATKNSVEITNNSRAHLKDGVALTKLLYLLDTTVGKQKHDELSIDIKLDAIRKKVDAEIFKDNNYKGRSFSSIVGVNSNGAIVHYKASKESVLELNDKSYLLLDCGAQYLEGTTDVTRTVSFKEQDEAFKKHFTLVLKGHIAVAKIKMKKGTTGANIDILARQYLWQEGFDYLHGTGHGVGVFLGVHEAPAGISAGNHTIFKEGMIVSNEPGCYVENKYGIRLENLYYVVKSVSLEDFLEFKVFTLVPFDMKNVKKELLSLEESNWLNDYHSFVYKQLEEFLDKEERLWFKNYTLIK